MGTHGINSGCGGAGRESPTASAGIEHSSVERTRRVVKSYGGSGSEEDQGGESFRIGVKGGCISTSNQ